MGFFMVSPSRNGDFIGFRWDFGWVLNGDFMIFDGLKMVFIRDNPMKQWMMILG